MIFRGTHPRYRTVKTFVGTARGFRGDGWGIQGTPRLSAESAVHGMLVQHGASILYQTVPDICTTGKLGDFAGDWAVGVLYSQGVEIRIWKSRKVRKHRPVREVPSRVIPWSCDLTVTCPRCPMAAHFPGFRTVTRASTNQWSDMFVPRIYAAEGSDRCPLSKMLLRK